MEPRPDFPLRVTRGEDGVLRWSGEIDRRHQRRVYKYIFGICGGALLLFVPFCIAVNVSMLWPTLLSIAAVMAVVFMVCFLMDIYSPDVKLQPYELSEESIHWVGYGNTDFVYSLRSVFLVRVRTAEHMLVVHVPFGVMHVYLREEDLPYVRDFILHRIRPSARVVIK